MSSPYLLHRDLSGPLITVERDIFLVCEHCNCCVEMPRMHMVPGQCIRSLPAVPCRKAAIDQPVRPFGFWTSDKANARYHTNLDPGVSSLPGRSRAQDE